jgi:hypothetical protein
MLLDETEDPMHFAVSDVKDLTDSQITFLDAMVAHHLLRDGWHQMQAVLPTESQRTAMARAAVAQWRIATTLTCKVFLWEGAPFLCALIYHDGPSRAGEVRSGKDQLRRTHPEKHLNQIMLHESKLEELGQQHPKHLGTH